jgi:inosine/xanthosine triphosphatase
MPTIVVASTNPVKIEAALIGFRRMFPAEAFTARGVAVPSGVSRQPFSDAETLQGALNRAVAAQAAAPDADFWVGIEGGCESVPRSAAALRAGQAGDEELAVFAWIVVCSRHRVGRGRTGVFFLPEAVAQWVRAGKELGEADDLVFGRTNSKQDNGAIGLLTEDVIDRVQYYEHAMIMALVPFKNPDLYPARQAGA